VYSVLCCDVVNSPLPVRSHTNVKKELTLSSPSLVLIVEDDPKPRSLFFSSWGRQGVHTGAHFLCHLKNHFNKISLASALHLPPSIVVNNEIDLGLKRYRILNFS
jgi:hypothetical protein